MYNSDRDKYLIHPVIRDKATGHKQTYVAFVLDESGSMGSCVNETLNGFNEQLNVIREEGHYGGMNFVSLYKFGCRPDSRPRRVFKNKKVSEMRDLSRENYSPFGMTPLRDGVGMALSDLEQHDKDDDVNRAFLVVVFTDGYENASVEWAAQQLSERMRDLQDRGNWTITYIGNEVDPLTFDETQFVYAGNMAMSMDVATGMEIATSSLKNYYSTTRAGGATATCSYLVEDKSTSDPD